MKKELWMSAVRHLLSGVGGLLVAYGIAKEGIVLDVSGTIISLVSVIWSIADKSYLMNTDPNGKLRAMIEGALRQLLTTAGSFIGFLKPDMVNQIMGVVVFLLPTVLGQINKLDTSVDKQPDAVVSPAQQTVETADVNIPL